MVQGMECTCTHYAVYVRIICSGYYSVSVWGVPLPHEVPEQSVPIRLGLKEVVGLISGLYLYYTLIIHWAFQNGWNLACTGENVSTRLEEAQIQLLEAQAEHTQEIEDYKQQVHNVSTPPVSLWLMSLWLIFS